MAKTKKENKQYVYILTESFQCDCDGTQENHTLFKKLEDAKKELKKRIEEIKKESAGLYDTEEIDETSASFYKMGYAAEWDLELSIDKAVLN